MDVNRGLGAGLVLSVLVHGGAVAALTVLGAAWLTGPAPPPASPPLYVDLVDPVIATSDRPSADGAVPRASAERSAIGGNASRARLRRAPPTEMAGVAPAPGVPSASPASAAGFPSAAPEVPRPPDAPAAPRPTAPSPESASPPAPAIERPAPAARAPAAPLPAAADPVPHGPAPDAAIAPSLALSPAPMPAAPTADSASRAAPLGSSMTGQRDAPAGSEGVAAAGPGDLRHGSGSPTSGRGSGSALSDGAGFARLSPGDGRTGDAPASAIPPEYEPYVRALRQRVQERLVYPWTAVRRSQQGVVELEVRLGADGRLVAVEVIAGVSAEALRGAAVAAVRSSAPIPFPPGLTARPLVVRLPVEFRLR